MSRARQAVHDIELLTKRGLTDALFRQYIHHNNQSMQGFRSYCERNPTIEFRGGNAGNCDRLRYAVKHLDDGPLEEVLRVGLKRPPKVTVNRTGFFEPQVITRSIAEKQWMIRFSS